MNLSNDPSPRKIHNGMRHQKEKKFPNPTPHAYPTILLPKENIKTNPIRIF
jgi:hypothetical protein